MTPRDPVRPARRPGGPRSSRTGPAAWIHVRTAGAAEVAPLAPFLLERTSAAVRQEDRVCPVGGGRLAVLVDPGAAWPAGHDLGARLVRTLRRAPDGTPLSVAVGVAVPGQGPAPPPDVAIRGARAAARRAAEDDEDSAVVVAREVLGTAAADAGVGAALLVRTRHPVPRDRRSGARDAAGGAGAALIVDPLASGPAPVGPGAAPVLEAAARAGWRALAAPVRADGPLPVAAGGIPADVVVLVLDAVAGSAHVGRRSPWERIAHVAAAYDARRIPVLAVDTGAGAGAVAAAAVAGALPVFSAGRVTEALASLAPADGGAAATWADPATPDGFAALVSLTAAERRVLDHLTAGRTAAEVADLLVLSVSTVRTHIRSILRKLDVRSQLSAVAVATGRGGGRGRPRTAGAGTDGPA